MIWKNSYRNQGFLKRIWDQLKWVVVFVCIVEVVYFAFLHNHISPIPNVFLVLIIIVPNIIRSFRTSIFQLNAIEFSQGFISIAYDKFDKKKYIKVLKREVRIHLKGQYQTSGKLRIEIQNSEVIKIEEFYIGSGSRSGNAAKLFDKLKEHMPKESMIDHTQL